MPPFVRQNMLDAPAPDEEQPVEEPIAPLDLEGPPPEAIPAAAPAGVAPPPEADTRPLQAGAGVSDMETGFNPDNSTFAERQANMTPQERADWASKKWGNPSPPSFEEVGAAPYGKPKGKGEDIGHNRNMFEEQVINQLGGNPFEIDVMKEVDKATASDLQALFGKVFGGKVIWADRNRLEPKQRQFWDNEVKKYRAFLKDAVESDKKTKIDVYNKMMTRFDNDRKEEEAALKKVQEVEAKAREKYEKSETKRVQEQDAARKTLNSLQAGEVKTMNDMAVIVRKVKESGAPPTREEELVLQAMGAQLRDIRVQRHAIRMKYDKEYRDNFNDQVREQEVGTKEATAKPGQGPGTQEASPEESMPKAEVSGFNVILGPKGKPKEVLRLKDGRLAAEYPDGTRAIIREAL